MEAIPNKFPAKYSGRKYSSGISKKELTQLSKARVVQRHLLYVIGLSPRIASRTVKIFVFKIK